MKRFFILSALTLTLLCTNIFATLNEINLNAGYANDIWFSCKNGKVKESPTNNWDIAFMTSSQNGGILLNSASGAALWVVKNSDGDSWDTPIDTTGMSATWDKGYNSIEKWQVGAFNLGLDGFEADGDFGWGSYDMTTHAIAGSKVFVIKLVSKAYKKIMIESLLGGVYSVVFADLDGKNEKKFTIKKSEYSSKLYTYYDLAANNVVDREPVYDSWDLVFSKYTDLIDMGNGTFTPYTVTGVRTHPIMRTATVKGIPTDKSNAPEINDDNYFSKITSIGSNWKKFSNTTMKYTITDSVSYFITADENGAPDPLINKIVFKSFEGSSTGKLTFELNGGSTSVSEELVNSLNIFPTIIDKSNNININLGEFNSSDLNNINIYSLNGELVKVIKTNFSSNFQISLSDVATGEYFMIFEFNKTNLLKKLIVK